MGDWVGRPICGSRCRESRVVTVAAVDSGARACALSLPVMVLVIVAPFFVDVLALSPATSNDLNVEAAASDDDRGDPSELTIEFSLMRSCCALV